MTNLPWPESGAVAAANQVCATTPPPILYHYTSASSFLSIAAERKLWASNPLYLNDARELSHGWTIVRDIAIEFYGEHQRDPLSLFYRRFLDDELAQLPSMYVSSFSGVGDQLSQWRAYGRGGGGISVGFDGNDLGEEVRRQGGALGRVIYDRVDQKQLVYDAFAEIAYYADVAVNDIPPPDQEGYYASVCHMADRSLAIILPFLKDPAFSEESEWRAVFASVPAQQELLRVSGSLVVPYIRWSLSSGDSAHLRELIVGPSPHSALTLQALKRSQTLAGTGSLRVQIDHIRLSVAPYRDW